MKKTLFTILMAIVIGFTFGYLFLRKFNTDTLMEVSSIKNQCYAFQVGVYKNKENAYRTAESYKGIVIPDNDLYRVYIAFLKDENLINSLKGYYDKNGIRYYLKAINISNKTNSIVDNYEIILKKTSLDNYGLILENMLKEVDTNEL